KVRWLLTVDTDGLSLEVPEADAGDGSDSEPGRMLPLGMSSHHLQVIHHNHDPAWINRQFIAAHWLPNNESIVFLSELDGYGHLYLHQAGKTTQLTVGKFEVRNPVITRSGREIYLSANVNHPGVYEIFRLQLRDAELEQITDLGGRNRFLLSPDESRLLITHSDALSPTELYVKTTRPNSRATRITHTISEAFNKLPWAQPEFIAVPSSQVSDPIHSRVYTPLGDSGDARAAVIFIHGAGYLQNAHQGWSRYFREFMFHSLLVQRGYVVLDMDYRASSGYGRDWRTAIYQQMGTPEVQDLADGIDYLVANKHVDRDRICTYGGSYGGFLTLMAMFNQPELFACGAALRPVTDWAAYNHGYTSNILNIPSLDPSAYERSSPIEFAEGLEKPLLIAHGMQDNNVFFQDSVRLVQRLIELKKENWEMAMYPIEAHGFREASSWLDEYRRILNLFTENLDQ
ncbi:MAG: S9 family peptidase, partial [Proteobacteria bacterium]|nr:S9 family peptidase [Pseudomonadota bacterium]